MRHRQGDLLSILFFTCLPTIWGAFVDKFFDGYLNLKRVYVETYPFYLRIIVLNYYHSVPWVSMSICISYSETSSSLSLTMFGA